MPTPLELALFVREHHREVRAPFPPHWLVKVTTAPLAALARKHGRAEPHRAPRRTSSAIPPSPVHDHSAEGCSRNPQGSPPLFPRRGVGGDADRADQQSW
jgi:hypothetical protein